MKWIKINIDIMDDPRIQKLVNSELGYKGLGIYIVLLTTIAQSPRGCISISRALALATGSLRKSNISNIILNFDLFHVNENGAISSRALGPADGPAGGPAGAIERANREERENKKIYKRNLDVEDLADNSERNENIKNGNDNFDDELWY